MDFQRTDLGHLVMLWSQDAAYMPAWGNHEWNTSSTLPDDFYNYLGRFAFSNSYSSPGTSAIYHYSAGEDWHWFDYGHVRFIAYPQAYSTATLPDWNSQVQSIMSAAQSDPTINFIVTYGHKPAYSSSGSIDSLLQGYLGEMAQLYPKYKLNLCGHHHHYERTDPSQTGGVTHIVVGTGHSTISTITTTQPSWSLFRTKQPGALKLHFVKNASGASIEGQFICAPASSVCNAANNAVAATWYHVAVSVDRAGAMKLYINGVLAQQADISAYNGISITNGGNVRIGRDHHSVYFNGVIDNLRVYNSASFRCGNSERI